MNLENLSKQIRERIIETALLVGRAHPGSSLSLVDILVAAVGGGFFPISVNRKKYNSNIIFSKAHGMLAYYCLLERLGYISEYDLSCFKATQGHVLPSEPNPNICPLTGPATGPLGGGIAFAVGVNLASNLIGRDCNNMLVVLGDGECQKGQILEALGYAASSKCNHLTAVIDYNNLQLDGETRLVTSMSLEETFQSCGWNVKVTDGHDIKGLLSEFKWATTTRGPNAIIAKTIKGKGIPEMENNPLWHYFSGEKADLLINCLSVSKRKVAKEKYVNFKNNKENSRFFCPREQISTVLSQGLINSSNT